MFLHYVTKIGYKKENELLYINNWCKSIIFTILKPDNIPVIACTRIRFTGVNIQGNKP